MGVAQVRVFEMGVSEFRVFEMGVGQVHVFEIGTPQSCVFEMGVVQERVFEMGTVQFRAFEMGEVQARVLEMNADVRMGNKTPWRASPFVPPLQTIPGLHVSRLPVLLEGPDQQRQLPPVSLEVGLILHKPADERATELGTGITQVVRLGGLDVP